MLIVYDGTDGRQKLNSVQCTHYYVIFITLKTLESFISVFYFTHL